MSDTNWSRCKDLLGGKDPSPYRIALACEEVAKCHHRPAQEIAKADPCSPVLLALLGHFLVQAAGAFDGGEKAVCAAEVVVKVLVDLILSDSTTDFNKFQHIRIVVGLCGSRAESPSCLSASEVMAGSAVLHLSGEAAATVSKSDSDPSAEAKSSVDAKDQDKLTDGEVDDDDDDEDDEDDDDDDEDDDDDNSSYEFSSEADTGKKTPQSTSSEQPIAIEKAKSVPADDNLDRRDTSARVAFLLQGLGGDKVTEIVPDTPPALPPKPPDMRSRCAAVLEATNAVSLLLEKGMSSPGLQSTAGSAKDMVPTMVTLCLQDIEFLHNVLTLFGHVTLTDGSADLLNRCSDLLTNFLEKILLFQHACNCCSAEQPVAEKDGDKGPGTTDSNRTPRIPRFLSKVLRTFKCLEESLDKRRRDPLYEESLGTLIFLRRACRLVAISGELSACKNAASDVLRCAGSCKFANVMADTLLQSISSSWTSCIGNGPSSASESAEGSSDSCERNKTSPCGLAITEFKLLDSILSVASGNFRKAARIANLMSSSGKSSAGRPRSGAGASKKDLFSRKNAARSEGVGAYLSMASRSHPSHKRLDQASSSDDEEKMFLDELMLTMPDEESSVGPDNVALLENATEYVCDLLEPARRALDLLSTILTAPAPGLVDLVRKNLGTWQLMSMGDILREMEILGMLSEEDIHELSLELKEKFGKFGSDLLAILRLLVLRKFLSEEQQIALLASLGFSLLEVGNWSLRGGVERVSVVGHVLVGDQEAGGTLCTKAIDRFLVALRLEVLEGTSAPLGVVDVNVAHFQLMLLLHYGLSAEKQKEVFLALVKIVVDASNMEAIYDQPPLILMRVLQFVDYLLYHFQYPSVDLTDTVRFNLFNRSSVSTPRFHAAADGCGQAYDGNKIFGLNPDTIPSRLCLAMINMEPRFYDVRSTASKGQSEPDCKAVEFLRGLCEEGYTYADFYSSMTTLLAAGGLCGVSITSEGESYENHAPLASCCVRSTVRYVWNLLTTLPPPCSSLVDIGEATSLGAIDMSGNTLSHEAMRYLSRLVVALQISIRLRSLDSDEKKMQFAQSAMEFHGQFSDADICLSVVVAAQDDVGADDWMKAISLVVSGFEGCCGILGSLAGEQLPAPLLLLATDICMWQARGCLDRWFQSAATSGDGPNRDELPAAQEVARRVAALASRALPVLMAFSRSSVLVGGYDDRGGAPPLPLPRGTASTSHTPGSASQSSATSFPPRSLQTAETSSSSNSASGAGTAAGSAPSTPTNPVSSSADSATRRGMSLSAILAQARNLTGALSGMASAIEALSGSPASAAMNSTTIDLLDELDSFRACIAADSATPSLSVTDKEEDNSSPVPTPVQPCSPEHLALYGKVLQLGTVTLNGKGAPTINHPLTSSLPNWLQRSITTFKGESLGKYPSLSANSDPQSQKHLHDLCTAHMSSLSGVTSRFNVSAALKHNVDSLLCLAQHVLGWCTDSDGIHTVLVNATVPCLLDATSQMITSKSLVLLEACLGTPSSEQFKKHVYHYIISAYLDVLMSLKTPGCVSDNKVASALLYVPSNMLEVQSQRQLVEDYFSSEGDLVSFLMLSSLPHIDGAITCQILSFFSKYCATLPKEDAAACQVSRLSALSKIDQATLTSWIRRVFITLKTDDFNRPRDAFNDFVMELVASSSVSVEAYKALLNAFLAIGEELLTENLNISFSLFVHCASSLADACGSEGHITLCTASTKWLAFGEKILLSQMKVTEGDSVAILDHPMLNSMTQLLRYLSNLSTAIKVASGRHQSDLPLDSEPPLQDFEGEWPDEIHDEEESGEESEDEVLHNKLCTFTTTQREFSRQHWYQCYTCGLVNNAGVCTICARVCHKGHDVAYARMGPFFCDCGAKPESCKALLKRSTDSTGGDGESGKANQSAFDSGETGVESKPRSSAQSRPMVQQSTPTQTAHQQGAPTPRALTMSKIIEPCKDQLIELMNSQGTTQTVLHMVQTLLPCCVTQGRSILSQHGRALARQAVEQLHNGDKRSRLNDQLVLSAAGSTEALFDNVRVHLNGEQGNVIRQLLVTGVIKRDAMCSVASMRNKKQQVAVNPEKGKITILQVSGLLRQHDTHRRKHPQSGESSSQGDSKRRKVTTRMTSTNVPFTILSMTSNPVNDEYVAVCGHKDVYVLVYSSSGAGTVSQQIILHPNIDSSNCILKAMWLPGSQTQLAIITADFIKIWDLGVDSLSPSYNYMLPSGKIIDATAAVLASDGDLILLVIGSAGYIYVQPVEEACSAQYGPFYMTNSLTMDSRDLQVSSDQVAGGGSSIYYSHTLQLLFVSYMNGKTFSCSLTPDGMNVKKLFPIKLKGSSKAGGLYQWSEVAGHPGLVFALSTTLRYPIVFMVEPDTITVCETKNLPPKSKVQGIVGIRHNASGVEYRTSLVVLCEDGVLRLFGVDPGFSSYWTQPAFHPSSPLASLQPLRQQKPAKAARASAASSQPVDFIENLTSMSDVEFAGNDILQVYSRQQVKHRLSVADQYLASTKSAGFTVDVLNENNSMVMCGVRVELGSRYSTDKTVPSVFSVADRPNVVVPGNSRTRWFDVLFTKEEALQYQKKFSITFGPSVDPHGVTIVHSIRVYGKTKEALGVGDDDNDDGYFGGPSYPADGEVLGDQVPGCLASTPSCVPITTASRFLASSLEVLESYFATVHSLDNKENMLGVALSTATELLVAPMPQSVTTQTQCLLAALHPTRQAFHVHKDQTQLGHVARCLQATATPGGSSNDSADAIELEVSTFEHLLAIARTVAVARPTNLFQFAHSPACHRALGLLGPGQDHVSDSSGSRPDADGHVEEPVLLRCLMKALWGLLELQPVNRNVLPVWHTGFRNVESVVAAVVQILLCFVSSDSSLAPCVVKHLVDMLLCANTTVGYACRRAIVVALTPTVKRRSSAAPASSSESAERSAAAPPSSSLLESVLRRHVSAQTPPLEDSATGGSGSGAADSSSGAGRGSANTSVWERLSGRQPSSSQGQEGSFSEGFAGGDRSQTVRNLVAALTSPQVAPDFQQLSSAEQATLADLLEIENVPYPGGEGGGGGASAITAAHIENLLMRGVMPEEISSLVHDDDPEHMIDMALALSMHDGSADTSRANSGSGSSGGSRAAAPAGSLLSSTLQQALQSGDLNQLSQLTGLDMQAMQSLAQSLGHPSAGGSLHMEADSHASQDVEVGSIGSTAALHQLVSDHGSSHAEVASTGADLLSLPESSQGAIDQDGSSDDDVDMEVGQVVAGARRDSATSSLSSLNDSAREARAHRPRTAEQSEVDSVEGDLSASPSQSGTPAAVQSTGGATAQTPSSPLCEVVDEEGSMAKMMCQQMHALSLQLLHNLIKHISALDSVGGLRAIPYLQTLLHLCSRLEENVTEDSRPALDELLETCLGQLPLKDNDLKGLSERSAQHEVQLVLLRLLSVLMSRVRSASRTTTTEGFMVCFVTAQTLVKRNILDFCLLVLKGLLKYWNSPASKESERQAPSSSGNTGSAATAASGSLLQTHLSTTVPDMSPFFLKGYIKGHAHDVFETFPQLVTEIILRLAYLIKKILDHDNKNMEMFSEEWTTCLAEYLMAPTQVACVRRQVRSLLMNICGSKEKYRQRRDLHVIQSHITNVFEACSVELATVVPFSEQRLVSLSYNDLLSLIEHLKSCYDVATQRVGTWQMFCRQNANMLLQLAQLSLRLVDGVVPMILMLLSCALTGKPSPSSEKSSKSSKTESTAGKVCPFLIEVFFKSVDTELLTRFIRAFLLDANSTTVRWQAHSLLLCLHSNGSEEQQSNLCNILWSLWPDLPRYGRKGAQFVDLLGYFASCGQLSPEKAKQCSSMAVALLRQQNKIMSQHPNGHIYHLLSDMVDFDGYYLESDPCLVCNNPEMPFTVLKLSSIRVDSKFTPTTQLVKLAGSYTIARFQLRINDSKRVKMVRTVNLFYNNRTVQSVVELKNKRGLWHHVKQVHLHPGQNEVKIEFPLPVVACNLMIEFADFYVNSQVSPETLQCPRCSAQVPTAPGVCSNCGENVYQCHKCRSINYDEKDPFLCTSCGFCKYAKFDFILHARTCCAVDPIENEDDRRKAVTTINGLLERADKSYRQIVSHRVSLESQLGGSVTDVEARPELTQQAPRTAAQQQQQMRQQARQQVAMASGSSSSNSSVNPNIMSVAHRYCSECRTTFEDLSVVIQKVLASRKELIEYDHAQQQLDGVDLADLNASNDAQQHLPRSVSSLVMAGGTHGNCYGCASAAVDHCITLLRAVAQSAEVRPLLISEGLICELMESNLHLGAQATRHNVKQLLCLLTRNNCHATHMMNKVLCRRVITAIKSYRTVPNLAGSVRNEMDLLKMSVHMEDLCWEQRLRSVFKLFLASNCIDSPVIMDAVSRPCSLILLHVVKMTSQTPAEKSPPLKKSCPGNFLHANTLKWLEKEASCNFQAWKRFTVREKPKEEVTMSTRERYLIVKYSQRWKINAHKASLWKAQVKQDTWLMRTLFCSSSRAARINAWHIIKALCTDDARCQHMLDLMMACLGALSHAAQSGREFLSLLQDLSSPLHWKLYLTVRGILPHLTDLISQEIAKLQQLEETNLGSDLSQGTALKMLTEMLVLFMNHEPIKQRFKSRLVGAVLDGYLNLRRLIIQRTKMVDETQEMLLKLLADMTSGTEEETKGFMAVCVKALSKYPMNDLRTPVIVFERLCSIVYPEENEKADFLMVLEKDPQQEEFLQGRMQGNPYNFTEPGLGPLMRDIKNKICRDCELVALLDDDASMELLVRNKIISLDLPVKDVYKKIWCDDGQGNEKVMRVVYRMTGLLGDATEEIVKTLGSGSGDGNDDEELYRMASVLSECGGLEAMLARLEHLPNLIRGQQMLHALLKLFGYALKLKANCVHLINPEKRAVPILLATLNQALSIKQEFCSKVAGQVLSILETILLEASQAQTDMAELTAGTSEVGVLLGFIESAFVRSHTPVLHGMMKVIPYLTFGHAESMCELIDHFVPHLNFDVFDEHQSAEDILYMDCFCGIVQGIQANEQGHRLKSLVLERSIVQHSIKHIQLHVPPYAASAGGTADKEWKVFLAKASLPYIMRLLTGLCKGHTPSQELVSEIIPALHHIEQTSSEGHVGSLAENVLEVLCENPDLKAKVKECRAHTRTEKKRRAMAMREKQLKELGMNVNKRGQVVASVGAVEREMAELVEESGLKCVICHEGYKNQPKKILCIYTFSKRCLLEEAEGRTRKNLGYFTVSHFNVVHYDCHISAVRLARIRDEWESASLQNSNTKCNGLMPIWGPSVTEATFSTCLARHNSHIQEFTGVREPSVAFVIHDIRMLLLRFVTERSFSEESGGGGRQSNIHFLPFIIQIALYVLTTTRRMAHESGQLASFLSAPSDKWVSMCYGAESPSYFLVLALVLQSPSAWKACRLDMLKRLILQAHARHDSQSMKSSITTTTPHDYSSVYKPMLCLFAMVDKFQSLLKRSVEFSDEEEFLHAWLTWMRHNDMAVLEAGDKVLRHLTEDLKDCESFDEFCDAAGLLCDIENPAKFRDDLLKKMASSSE